MGQIVGGAAKPKRCNLNKLSQLGTPAAGEHILVSSNNNMNAAGQGNFDRYIVGNGTTDATALELKKISLDINDVRDLYIDKYTYLDLENVTGWNKDNVVNLVAGNTYTVTITNIGNATTSFMIIDEDGNRTSAPFTSDWRYSKVDKFYTTEYTPEVNIVKIDFYSDKQASCSVTGTNTNKILLTKDDFVDNLMEGGTDKPVSAEQGKELNENISILNQYAIPLSLGEYMSNKAASDSFTKARACFANNGFKYFRIKDGYEYILYGSDVVSYTGTPATTIIGTYTSDIYINTSSLAYFFITVKRTDGEVLQMDELFDIITLELDASIYNFKHLNDVSEYYKYAKEFDIEDYGYIEGEGISIYQGVNASSAYRRTTNIDVSELDALKIYYDSDWDTTSNKKVICGWFDESNNYLWTTKFLLRTQDRIVILEVPKNVKYASIDCSDKKFKIVGLKHEKTAADAHYYNSGKSEIAKLKDVTLILCCGQSLMAAADSIGISPEETYFPVRRLGYVNNSDDVRNFKRLTNAGSITREFPERGMGEMFVETLAKENGISVYANEWEKHLLVFVNTSEGGHTIAELTDDTLYQRVTKGITDTKTLCDKFGLTMSAPVWVWFQGEQDLGNGMTSANYKTALLAYQDKICNSLSIIAGITKRPKCCVYQPASQCLPTNDFGFNNQYLQFNNAYVELIRDNDEFIACAPSYIFDPSESGYWVHLSARSYKVLGAYAGYSIKKAIIDGVKVKGVIPIDITVDGTTINIKYNVPCPPLKFDTDWVKETPLTNGIHNYGFNVVKSDNTELITNVSVFDDTVTIECSESPIGAKLRYGLNGDYIRVGTQSGYVYSIDGRIHGGRGNLRDSQGDYVQKEIRELGQTMRLDNWAYCFEELLTEPEGE